MKHHYVDNKKFNQAFIDYKELVKINEELGKQKPKVPEYIGECLIMIANRLSYSPNFINYSFREEMISDGIENCLLYIDNFDPEKSSNPFAYFTQINYYAFIRRIQKENKQSILKGKLFSNKLMDFMTINEEAEDDFSEFVENLTSEYSIHVNALKKEEEKQKIRKEIEKESIVSAFDDFIEV